MCLMTSVFVTAAHSDILRQLFNVSSLLCACLSLFLCSAFFDLPHFLVVEHCSALIMKFVQSFSLPVSEAIFLTGD